MNIKFRIAHNCSIHLVNKTSWGFVQIFLFFSKKREIIVRARSLKYLNSASACNSTTTCFIKKESLRSMRGSLFITDYLFFGAYLRRIFRVALLPSV